ncbi:unnamed protein product [Calypogeia fissa]
MMSALCLPPNFSCSSHFTHEAFNSTGWVATSRASSAAVVLGGRLGSAYLEKVGTNNSTKFWRQRQPSVPKHLCHSQAPNSSEATAADNGDDEQEDSSMPLSTFEEFVKLNIGSWGGHFYQFDILGRKLQQIPTRLDAYSSGKGTDIALHYTLKIKEALSKTSIPGEIDEPTWAEMKLDPTNLSTVDRPQQIVYFPEEKAYCISHQTANVLNKVLRAGVLGEDDDEREESPKGLLDVIGFLIEKKIEGPFVEVQSDLLEEDAAASVDSLVGHWAGPAVTRRTGVYGSTMVESDVAIKYEILPGGFISQEFWSSRGYKVNLTGQIKGSVLDFEGGLQTIILPGGIAVSAPISVGRSVGRSQSFAFEFSWMQSPGQRQRLVRTYDTDGLVVSTTWSLETKR